MDFGNWSYLSAKHTIKRIENSTVGFLSRIWNSIVNAQNWIKWKPLLIQFRHLHFLTLMRTNPTQINQKFQEFECQSYAYDNEIDFYSKKTDFCKWSVPTLVDR